MTFHPAMCTADVLIRAIPVMEPDTEEPAAGLSLQQIKIGNTLRLNWLFADTDGTPRLFSCLAAIIPNPLSPNTAAHYERTPHFQNQSRIRFYARVHAGERETPDTHLVISALCCDFTKTVTIVSVYELIPYPRTA